MTIADEVDSWKPILPRGGGHVSWDDKGDVEPTGPPKPGAPITQYIHPSPGMGFYVQLDRLEVPPPRFERVVDDRDGAITYVQVGPDPDPKMDLKSTWHKVVRVQDIGLIRDENVGAGGVILEGRRVITTGCGITVENDPRDKLGWKGRLNEAHCDPWLYRTRCHKSGCWPTRKKG